MRGPPGPRGSSQEPDKSERRAADSQVPVPGALLPRRELSSSLRSWFKPICAGLFLALQGELGALPAPLPLPPPVISQLLSNGYFYL